MIFTQTRRNHSLSLMERSFGIIPLRFKEKKWETLLVKHGKGHWAFPKGHLEAGETPQAAAIRELEEETHLRVKKFLPFPPLKEFYVFKKEGMLIEKFVTYFIAEVEGEILLQKEEIDAFQWLNLDGAMKLATFNEAKALISRLIILLEGKLE